MSRCFFSVLRGGLQKWTGISIACRPRAIGSSAFFPTPNRSPAPRPRDFQAWASCTNRQTTRPQNQNHPRNQLPAADWRSKPDPSAMHAHGAAHNRQFPLRSQFAPCQPLSRKTKSHGRAPNRRRIWATHLPSPTPSLPLGRHRMHVHCTTGPVRPGRKPSPAVPVPRHGRKRGPLRCVDQVPRAG